jgi:hypothetical protein
MWRGRYSADYDGHQHDRSCWAMRPYCEHMHRTEEALALNLLSMVIMCVCVCVCGGEVGIASVTSLELSHVLDKLSDVMGRTTYGRDYYCNRHVGRTVFTEAAVRVGLGQNIDLRIGHYATQWEKHRRLVRTVLHTQR